MTKDHTPNFAKICHDQMSKLLPNKGKLLDPCFTKHGGIVGPYLTKYGRDGGPFHVWLCLSYAMCQDVNGS